MSVARRIARVAQLRRPRSSATIKAVRIPAMTTKGMRGAPPSASLIADVRAGGFPGAPLRPGAAAPCDLPLCAEPVSVAPPAPAADPGVVPELRVASGGVAPWIAAICRRAARTWAGKPFSPEPEPELSFEGN
jgi:hypothetical protein